MGRGSTAPSQENSKKIKLALLSIRLSLLNIENGQILTENHNQISKLVPVDFPSVIIELIITLHVHLVHLLHLSFTTNQTH